MNSNSANNSTDKGKAGKSDKNVNLKNLFDKYLTQLENKFSEIEKEVKEIPNDPEEFKNHSLPLARIKKIMKLDDEVKMIAGETPILFSKACELFIIELAYRSWIHTLENNRRTLQRCDIANAISRTDFYDFLIDIVEESCRTKLHHCANYHMDPLNMNFMNTFYPQPNQNMQMNMPMNMSMPFIYNTEFHQGVSSDLERENLPSNEIANGNPYNASSYNDVYTKNNEHNNDTDN